MYGADVNWSLRDDGAPSHVSTVDNPETPSQSASESKEQSIDFLDAEPARDEGKLNVTQSPNGSNVNGDDAKPQVGDNSFRCADSATSINICSVKVF